MDAQAGRGGGEDDTNNDEETSNRAAAAARSTRPTPAGPTLPTVPARVPPSSFDLKYSRIALIAPGRCCSTSSTSFSKCAIGSEIEMAMTGRQQEAEAEGTPTKEAHISSRRRTKPQARRFAQARACSRPLFRVSQHPAGSDSSCWRVLRSISPLACSAGFASVSSVCRLRVRLTFSSRSPRRR